MRTCACGEQPTEHKAFQHCSSFSTRRKAPLFRNLAKHLQGPSPGLKPHACARVSVCVGSLCTPGGMSAPQRSAAHYAFVTTFDALGSVACVGLYLAYLRLLVFLLPAAPDVAEAAAKAVAKATGAMGGSAEKAPRKKAPKDKDN